MSNEKIRSESTKTNIERDILSWSMNNRFSRIAYVYSYFHDKLEEKRKEKWKNGEREGPRKGYWWVMRKITS